MENNKRRERKDHDEELEEEVKMEKFYSLLRSFREARDRRRKELEEESQKNESNKKRIKSSSSSSVKPNPAEACFQREDFTTEIQFRRPPLIFPSPIPSDTDKRGKKEQHQDHALDLKLAL